MSILNAFGTVGKALKALSLTEKVIKVTDSDEGRESSEENKMSEEQEPRTLVEEIEVEGRQLVDRVKALLHEGNVRKLRIKDAKGKYLFEVPLTVGVVVGGVVAWTAPVWAALSALAGLAADVKIEVIREVDDSRPSDEDD